MKNNSLILFLFLCISFPVMHAQSFQIMRYGIEDGLCHESTFSVIQDSKGFIWIATTQGLCRLDGLRFTSDFIGDVLPGSIAAASFRDSKDRIWFGYVDGEISMLENNTFKVFTHSEQDVSAITGFAEDKKGNIIAMTQQSGMIRFDTDLKISYLNEQFGGAFISDFLLTPGGELLIGGFDGLTLYTLSDTTVSMIGKIEGIPFARVQDIKAGLDEGVYWLGTEDEGLYRLVGSGNKPENYIATQMAADQGLIYSSIYSVLVDDAGYLWVSDYGKGVYRFRIDENNELTDKLLFDVLGGMPEEYIKDIHKDDEGNIWFASQSNGVAILRDQAFTFYDLAAGEEVPEITSISLEKGNFWFGSREGMLFWTNARYPDNYKVYGPSSGIPRERITALWQDKAENLYIGTEASGVFILNKANSGIRQFFRSNNSLGNTINSIDGDSMNIWIATNDGLYIVNRQDGSIQKQNTTTGLPHNVINDVMVDSKGLVWIATRGSGIYCVNQELEEQNYTIQGNPKLEFMCLAEDKKGQIWAGSSDDGVFKFAEQSPAVYSVEQGLKAKYTYAIEVDPKGYVWVGHRLGLSKIEPETGNIVVFDQEMGFTSDILPRAIDVSDNGLMLFGTNNGLIVYDTYKARMDTVPPRLNLTQLTISDSVYNTNSDIRLPYGAYRIRFDFVGINLTNPDQVTYKYKLEGFDEWSEFSRDAFAKYSRIEDGEYTFMLAACDGSGNCTGEVAMINITVKIPIWKAWWFIVSLFIIAISSVFIIIKVRERNQKALQIYLEQQLEERTREVVIQKEEIEIKNRDITDSINYAQRIQASILPPIQRLEKTFSGSFVFYQPRDIVSGDFYWYDKMDDDRFLIVCADSTGHGVPGAFMSMIGTTLIKDICLREHVKTPSDVLATLDEEVREALHQNKETDGSNDGMDIIVAEFNLKTNKFVVSSAMRPVILYIGGEQIYVKGSRSSVGGQLDDTSLDKNFANEEFQLNKGDIVYMFSDGYPDQFGGPLGRKFKMVRLKNLLRDIHDKSMEEQHNYVKSNFFLWKEDLEQVDDVLFMGIKI